MTTQLTSYIDSSSLEECLDLYFQGEFDSVDQYLPRLYRNSSELKPGNSLFGQLDSADLETAIWGLDSLHRAAIEFYCTDSHKSWIILRHHYYFQDNYEGSLLSYICELYHEALQLLSIEVMKLI
ncbi:hypothetical protein GTQ43_30365 [Nostoc sp. KVJ3]|uniref:hypothetical protein n=1 Tax=Nostoc sp. KVJ3 TaxID=457945 RepID=UPI002237336F|nr:hypothetical protein [Nostoc sp. KVJ3]MCW5317918.1 hypothetical protein [Nostoc sp. KVJ3]